MPFTTRFRLSFMMFLQFFIWGAWFVTLGTYLGQGLKLDAVSIGAAYSTMPWGALIAPFFVGMVADRFFNSEHVLAVCHLIGAVAMFAASTVTDSTVLFWALMLYALAYNPTLALVNAISFNQLTDTGKQFPAIRVWGTIGWIVAGLAIAFINQRTAGNVEATDIPLKMAAGASLLLAGFAFFLPKTPPKPTGAKITIRDVLGLDALSLLKSRSFAIFTLGSLLISIPLAFYYNFTNLFLNEVGVENAAGKMTMGQMSEIVFMLILPVFLVRLGIKYTLLIGMAAWAARYLLFAFGDSGDLVFMLYLGIILHGVCYDFFFVTGQIHVDTVAPKRVQASAQGFITLVTYGLGMLIGAWASGLIVNAFATVEGEVVSHHWQAIWIVPAAMAGVIIVLFALFFKDPKADKKQLAEAV